MLMPKLGSRKRIVVLLALVAAGCRHAPPVVQTQPPPPPLPPAPPPSSLIVLIPEPAGKATGLTVSNAVGSQTLDQPYQAVSIVRGAAPSAPFMMDEPSVNRAFGALLAALPSPEISFLLHFQVNTDVLTPDSRALLPAVFNAVRERRSTAITVIGHTDTTGTPAANYQLGLRRANAVADLLRAQGAAASDLIVESHGEADLLVKTLPGRDEPLNRRVEIIVR
jgi:peptidoglycan-associated lipoprotein